MQVTIKGKKMTMKATVGGNLEQKLAFLSAVTGVAVDLHKSEAVPETQQQVPSETP